jgi:FKBP-type peptidyl-prolyl cis-trans isomerase
MKWLWIGLMAASVAAFAGCSDSGSTGGSSTDSSSSAASNAPPAPSSATSDGPAKVDEKQYKTTASGLKYAVLAPGSGAEAKDGDNVHVHYSGWLENGTKFDSSVDRGEPIAFPLGQGMVIKGWDEGVKGMKIGEKRQLRIPSDLGYGPSGQGPIPPNATLIFDVELVKIGQ